jgi:uncharacterized RDD family membrane protein YckC
MAAIKISTNFNIDLEFEAAPFHRRLLAWIFDIIVLIVYLVLAFKLLNYFAAWLSPEATLAFMMLMFLPCLTYNLFSEILMNGQSIGKRIMRLRVVNENGGSPSIGQFVIRWLIRTSDYMIFVILLYAPQATQNGDTNFIWKIGIPLSLLLADIFLVNSKKGQRLGDLLAHTLVISANKQSSINDTIFLEVADGYVPSFPQVMQLNDRDINSLKGILDTARKRHDYNFAEMAAEKVKSHLKISTTLSAFDFLEVLLKDYNYLSTN